MKNILIVNDDGIYAKGIEILKTHAKKYAKVYVVAPLEEQSGKSQAITIKGGAIDCVEVAPNEFGITGTPADCTKFGLHHFEEIEFDFIFSGINDGPNLGEDVFYSGTVGGATEGLFNGIPSVAFSCGKKHDWHNVEQHLSEVIEQLVNGTIPVKGAVLNINFPSDKFTSAKGIKFTKQGKRHYKVSFIKEDGKYYSSYETTAHSTEEGSDIYETRNGYITITPLLVDRSDLETLKKLRG